VHPRLDAHPHPHPVLARAAQDLAARLLRQRSDSEELIALPAHGREAGIGVTGLQVSDLHPT
jgi:hypothetical protein